MFFLQKPSPDKVQQFISSQRELPFSYAEVGATQTDLPSGYTVDHNRVQLGSGKQCYESAIAAIQDWKQFDLGWVRLVPAGTPLETGAVVAILTRHFGIWSLNACRVVYLINEDGPPKKFGFAYGTLSSHVERGEERFTIEWHNDDTVWYDILAFSKPNQLLIRFGLPIARMLQRRFAKDSLKVMVNGVRDEIAR